jgi:hypothetical protein
MADKPPVKMDKESNIQNRNNEAAANRDDRVRRQESQRRAFPNNPNR